MQKNPVSSSFLVAPSILSADFSRLGEEISNLITAGADWLHVDVMDGVFVPNLTIGAPVVKAIKPVTSIPMDVHLMVERPEKLIEDFAQAGADYLTIHIESTDNAGAVLKAIAELGVKPGISLKPGTSVKLIEPLLPLVSLVLVMTVEPGFGGQKFMSDQVAKIDQLNQWRQEQGLSFLIEVDGGITDQTAAQVPLADVLVAGSYIFKNEMAYAISSLKKVNR